MSGTVGDLSKIRNPVEKLPSKSISFSTGSDSGPVDKLLDFDGSFSTGFFVGDYSHS